MTRFKKILILTAAVLVLSCLSKKRSTLIDVAAKLALHEELTEISEAVVWLRGPLGELSSHWVKNDVSGVIVVGSRRDSVVPVAGALWHFPTEDTLNDYDWLELVDLVSGKKLEVPLDDEIADDFDNEDPDGGVADSGVNDDNAENGCDIRAIQALPVLLGAVGPYLFAQYNEKQYDCNDTLLLSRDRYVTVNLVTGEQEDVLTDEELAELMEIDEVRELERDGRVEYLGSTPLYNGKVEPLLSHVFATISTFVQEDGDYHAVVNSLEILGKTTPESIRPFVEAPELVQAFSIMYPQAMPAGWWPIPMDPSIAKKQLEAFGVIAE